MASIVARSIVRAQRIATEVALEVAIHGVDVIGVVLRVVVLDEQRGPVHAVVVRLPALDAACPGKAHLAETCTIEAQHRVPGRGRRHAPDIQLDEAPQLRFCFGGVHVRGGEPFELELLHLGIIAREDVGERGVANRSRSCGARRATS